MLRTRTFPNYLTQLLRISRPSTHFDELQNFFVPALNLHSHTNRSRTKFQLKYSALFVVFLIVSPLPQKAQPHVLIQRIEFVFACNLRILFVNFSKCRICFFFVLGVSISFQHPVLSRNNTLLM